MLWRRSAAAGERLERGEFEALLSKETLAEAVPLAWGAKITVNDAFCPAAMVNGKENPLRANSEVLGVPEETVTLGTGSAEGGGHALTCPHDDAAEVQVSCGTDRQLAGGCAGPRQRDCEV